VRYLNIVVFGLMRNAMEQRPQKATAKSIQFLLKTGTNLNKILDIHVIEDFIKALQCATLILVCFVDAQCNGAKTPIKGSKQAI